MSIDSIMQTEGGNQPPEVCFVDDVRCTYPLISNWSFAEEMINRRKTFWTTQMGLMSLPLLDMGYRVYVQDKSGFFEIKLGNKNERTDREIRPEHNLFKMWMNGEFLP